MGIEITDEEFTAPEQRRIAAEAALDGVYLVLTSLPEQALERDDVVLRSKDLADVERNYPTLNTELDVRPIHHRLPDKSAPPCSYACYPTTWAGT